jgi:hypothetical protein
MYPQLNSADEARRRSGVVEFPADRRVGSIGRSTVRAVQSRLQKNLFGVVCALSVGLSVGSFYLVWSDHSVVTQEVNAARNAGEALFLNRTAEQAGLGGASDQAGSVGPPPAIGISRTSDVSMTSGAASAPAAVSAGGVPLVPVVSATPVYSNRGAIDPTSPDAEDLALFGFSSPDAH